MERTGTGLKETEMTNHASLNDLLHEDRRSALLRRAALVTALLLGFAAASCHTVEGVGEDVESVGESTQNAARAAHR
jgi:predicted small secreted protein